MDRFRIEKAREKGATVLFLSGKIELAQIPQLEEQLASESPVLALDLDEITIVSAEVVDFLNDLEKRGVQLRRCPQFLREWIFKARDAGGS